MNSQPFQEKIARQFPPNYRDEIIPTIMDLIVKGDSCYIVGINGVGKSNLFRCIWHRDTREKYLGDQTNNFAFVWADTNGLAGDLSAFYLYELILYNLQKWVEDNENSNISPAFFQELHEKVVSSGENQVLAQRFLETAIRYLFRNIENYHLVLLFDEFEPILKTLDFQFFRNLRWLRDEFKYHLSYIMSAHKTPAAVRREFFDQAESLYELFISNFLGLKPYDRDDSIFMIAELSKRYNYKPEVEEQEFILSYSGGHSGLISAIFKILLKQDAVLGIETDQTGQLMKYDSIAGECRKIWNCLEDQEQDILLQIRKNNFIATAPLKLNSLIAKGVILKDTRDQISIFSPLFKTFLAETF